MKTALARRALPQLLDIDGCVGACVVDQRTSALLGSASRADLDLPTCAAHATSALRAQRAAIAGLGLASRVEDILVSSRHRYHLARPLGGQPDVVLCLILDKAGTNIAVARHELAAIERSLAR